MRTLEDYGNRALFGAYKKGYEAGKAGKPRSMCPYVDRRRDNWRNSVTFSRAFIHAWGGGVEGGAEVKTRTVRCAGYKWEYTCHGQWRTVEGRPGVVGYAVGRYWIFCYGRCWHWQRGGEPRETWRGCHKTMRDAMRAVVRFGRKHPSCIWRKARRKKPC